MLRASRLLHEGFNQKNQYHFKRCISSGTIGLIGFLGIGSAFGGVLYLGQKQVRFQTSSSSLSSRKKKKKNLHSAAAHLRSIFFQQHTQTIKRLIDASVKSLESNVEREEEMNQHWALLHRCLKKKAYAAQLLADAGGKFFFK